MKFLKALIARLLRIFAKKAVAASAAVAPAAGAPQPKV